MLPFNRRRRPDPGPVPTPAAENARERLRSKQGTFAVTDEMRSLLLANADELLAAKDDLSLRERVCLSAQTNLPLETALTLDVNTLGVEFFHRFSVRASNLFRANLGPAALLRYGVSQPEQLRDLGVDSLDFLLLPPVAIEAVSAYGPANCRRVWLTNSVDAINLSGSEAAVAFEADLARLLEQCVDLPCAAAEVLKLHPSASLAVRSLPRDALLNTGIVMSQLGQVNVWLTDLLAAGYTPAEMKRLGVSAFRL